MSINDTLRILLNLLSVQLAFQYCYKMNLLGFQKTDTPNYHLSMQMFKNNTISSQTLVLEDISLPLWHFTLVQRTPNQLKVYYNGTVKICEFYKFVKRVRVFRDITKYFTRPESGNMSLTCPLPKGLYILQNVTVPPDTGILKFIYAPKSIYILYGVVMAQLPDKSVKELCTYTINATVIKTC